MGPGCGAYIGDYNKGKSHIELNTLHFCDFSLISIALSYKRLTRMHVQVWI